MVNAIISRVASKSPNPKPSSLLKAIPGMCEYLSKAQGSGALGQGGEDGEIGLEGLGETEWGCGQPTAQSLKTKSQGLASRSANLGQPSAQRECSDRTPGAHSAGQGGAVGTVCLESGPTHTIPIHPSSEHHGRQPVNSWGTREGSPHLCSLGLPASTQ